MTAPNQDILKSMAAKYIWWKTPDDAVAAPERVVAQVMNLGDFSDVQEVVRAVGEDYLRQVLAHAQIGQFSERSWTYWHYRLGLAQPEQVPAMPTRRLP